GRRPETNVKPLLYPFTAMLGIYEIALMLIALAVGVAIATGGIVFLIWLVNRARQTPPSPQSIPGAPPVSSATQPVASSVIAASASVSTGPCPRCGAAVDPNSPQGLCPKCLLAVGMGTQPSAGADPVPPPDPAELADRFPNLEILELIGAGGMGVVYKARQRQLDRLVALKVLPREAARDPAFAERFHREARMLARLNHPSIITVHEFGETDGLYYLVMEYVDGTDLRRILQERRLTPAEALQIVPALCDALQYAHANGVVHRDIKPGNILLDREGRIKIADFGIAKLLGQAS